MTEMIKQWSIIGSGKCIKFKSLPISSD